jgi:hypothetical protein
MGPVGGLLVLVLVTVMLGVAVGVPLYRHEIGRWLRRVHHRFRPPPEPPAGHAIERIAHDARRVRAEIVITPQGTPMARRAGVVQAYDELLGEACRALGIPDTLTGMEPGFERDAERLHVESRLDAAGLHLTG